MSILTQVPNIMQEIIDTPRYSSTIQLSRNTLVGGVCNPDFVRIHLL